MIELLQQGPATLFAAFVLGHVLADFPLQSEYLATQKVRSTADSFQSWIVGLSAHCIIHAGAVWIITGSLVFAAAELVLHGLIDFGKGKGKFGLLVDQGLHLACKLAYVIILTRG